MTTTLDQPGILDLTDLHDEPTYEPPCEGYLGVCEHPAAWCWRCRFCGATTELCTSHDAVTRATCEAAALAGFAQGCILCNTVRLGWEIIWARVPL
jgi:hypothetical protein